MKENIILSKFIILLIIIITSVSNIYGQEKIIKEGDEWYYFDHNSTPAQNWFIKNTNNNHWKLGYSPLGYGDNRIKTTISFGENQNKKDVAKYFKKTFRIKDPFKYLMYELKVQRDDGIIVYLNGYEILRNNLPEGEITHETLATNLVFSDKNEEIFYTKVLSPDDLIAGVNTISISVHQARVASSDCLFNLELIGHNNQSMLPKLLKERSLKNLKLIANIKELNYKLELEKKDQLIEFLEHTKNNFKTILIISIILLFFLISGIIYFRKQNLLKEKHLNQHILELNETNAKKDREMMNISLNSFNNQQYLEGLKKDLEKNISENSEALKKGLTTIIKQLEYNIEFDNNWETLKHHFNAVHSGFIEKLTASHPSLSETEIRHCVFMKLHLQTKEIARILHIDPRSVQASRYRIKKKMDLKEDYDLKDYIQKFN